MEGGHAGIHGALGAIGFIALGAIPGEIGKLRLLWYIQFEFDGREGAEKNLSEVSQDGGAACRDAVLDEKYGDLCKKVVNTAGALESRKQAGKGGREVFVRGLEGRRAAYRPTLREANPPVEKR